MEFDGTNSVVIRGYCFERYRYFSRLKNSIVVSDGIEFLLSFLKLVKLSLESR